MEITTLSSRAFNQDVGKAKRAAQHGPVIITDRGKPSHVLLSMEQYQRLTSARQNLVEALSMPGLSEIDLETPKISIKARPADLS